MADHTVTGDGSHGLRVIAVGPETPRIRERCLAVDEKATFLSAAGEVQASLAARSSPNESVVIVSTDLDVTACYRIVADETRLDDPLSLGFVVNPDPAFVERWLDRLLGPCPSPPPGRFVAFLDDALVGLGLASVEDMRLGGDDRPEREATARSPLGCALFYGHSNGHCHCAGGLAICQRDRHYPRPGEPRQLPCFGNAGCRFEGNENIGRVSADELRAEVIIDLTCFGYVLGDHALRASDGVGRAMLENRRLRALVSSLRAISPTHHDYRLAAYLARDGVDMGRLVGALNRARVGELGESADFICLGDPRAKLASRVVNGGETPHAECTVSRPPERTSGPCDMSVGTRPAQDEVMLYSGASSAAWAPNGRVYVTLRDAQASARLVRVPTASARMTVSGEPLLPHLDFLEHYLTGIREHASSAGNAELTRALADAESTRLELRRMGLKLHPTIIRSGSVFDANVLADISDRRFERLESLSQSLLMVHRHTLTARSLLFDAGVETLAAVAAWCAGPACAYCGAATTALRKGLAGSSFERTTGFCDRCGRLFEGAGFATTLETESSGRLWSVRVRVVNGFPFEVPIHGVAALQTFDDRHNRVATFEPRILEPDEAAELHTELRIPQEVPRGMHRAKAAITVGPQVELLVRNALVVP